MNKEEFGEMILYLTTKIDDIVKLPEKEFQEVFNCMKALIKKYKNYKK